MARLSGDLEAQQPARTVRHKGSVLTTRKGLWYRHRRSGPRHIDWADIVDWSVGPDPTPGVPSHTHAFVLRWRDGALTLRVRGPWGALALVRLRDAIRLHLHRLLI